MANVYKKLLETEEGRVALAEEHAIAHVSELLAQLLEKSGMTRKELAGRLAVTPGRITQLLDGDANLTLATIARILNVFGHVFEATSRPIGQLHTDQTWQVNCELAWSNHDYQADFSRKSADIVQTIGWIPTRTAG